MCFQFLRAYITMGLLVTDSSCHWQSTQHYCVVDLCRCKIVCKLIRWCVAAEPINISLICFHHWLTDPNTTGLAGAVSRFFRLKATPKVATSVKQDGSHQLGARQLYMCPGKKPQRSSTVATTWIISWLPPGTVSAHHCGWSLWISSSTLPNFAVTVTASAVTIHAHHELKRFCQCCVQETDQRFCSIFPVYTHNSEHENCHHCGTFQPNGVDLWSKYPVAFW